MGLNLPLFFCQDSLHNADYYASIPCAVYTVQLPSNNTSGCGMQQSPVYCSYKYAVSRFRSMPALACKADLNSIHNALLPALWWPNYYMKRCGCH